MISHCTRTLTSVKFLSILFQRGTMYLCKYSRSVHKRKVSLRKDILRQLGRELHPGVCLFSLLFCRMHCGEVLRHATEVPLRRTPETYLSVYRRAETDTSAASLWRNTLLRVALIMLLLCTSSCLEELIVLSRRRFHALRVHVNHPESTAL